MKGIEPSYSAWKAAALPLSYTRAQAIAYHATDGASTAMRRLNLAGAPRKAACSTVLRGQPALNMARFAAYIEISINNERR